MSNAQGGILDNNRITYRHGSPDISTILQSQLEGLLPGQSKKIFLFKGQEDADDDFTFDVFIEDVRDATTPIPLKIHLLSGFLGSGKTTAIVQACRFLQKQHIPVVVITNDQGTALVDSGLFAHLGVPYGQITNGCFCCNYHDLEAAIRFLSTKHHPHIIFAESVGSCTDLVATVFKPLLQQHPDWQLTITAFTDANTLASFDPDVRYINHKQLEEAPLIVISKTDLYGKPSLPPEYTHKTILYQNSFDETHIARWLQTLGATSFTHLPSLAIDYDRYGAGETKLAWLDQLLEIHSPSQQAQQAAIALMTAIAATDYPIAHLKFLLDGNTKLSFTNKTSADPVNAQPAFTASLLINARIQADPAGLTSLLSSAIQHTIQMHKCSIRTVSGNCFQPGYPRPTHRIS